MTSDIQHIEQLNKNYGSKSRSPTLFKNKQTASLNYNTSPKNNNNNENIVNNSNNVKES